MAPATWISWWMRCCCQSRIGKPVKSMWTREDDVKNGRFRPLSAHLLKAGFDASGRLVAWQHRLVGDRVTPFADPVRYREGR